MSPRMLRIILTLSSISFAVLWTAGMYALWSLGLWLDMPPTTAGIVILVIAGGVVGVMWDKRFGKWFLEHFAPDSGNRDTRNL
jgi:membrane protease YdiL (CAAX protease family)